MKKYFISAISIAILLSCGSNENEVSNSQTSNSDSTKTESVQKVEVDYEASWQEFIEAVETNDLEKFKSFCGPDVYEQDFLIVALQEDWVLTPLKASTFESLTDSDFNGTPVKEFSADVEGSDDEGNIYESAIFLYVEKTDSGIRIVNTLMAG